MHIIETRDLCFSYRDRELALKNVNFIAGRKERIAVIGANGAGKSTLFRHFNGILKPSSGEVLVHGEHITKENIREVRKSIGIVFQNPDDQIFSPTVEQDVAFGPHNLGLEEEVISHRVEEALKICSIEHLRGRVPHHLSGGEKKRVAIAGIIAMEPQVMVMDEPTAGLDPRGVKDLISFVNTLPEEYGMTVIFSTHHIDIVPEIADTIYVMNKGAVVGKGSVDEIFQDYGLLESASLEMPPLPRLMASLREKGIGINPAYTFEEVERTLLELFTRQG